MSPMRYHEDIAIVHARPAAGLTLHFKPSSHWLRRSGVGLLALFLAGPASLADAPARPKITIEQSVFPLVTGRVAAWGDNTQGQTTLPLWASEGVRAI